MIIVTLEPLDAGRPSYGPYRCLRFHLTANVFNAELEGRRTLFLPLVGIYSLQAEPA